MTKQEWFKQSKTPQELLENMKDFEYGWVQPVYGEVVVVLPDSDLNLKFYRYYRLQNSQSIIDNQICICWDAAELEEEWFHLNGYKTHKIYMHLRLNPDQPTHTFIVYEKGNDYYYFEHTWEKYRGIHKFTTLGELISCVSRRHIKYHNAEKKVNDCKCALYVYEIHKRAKVDCTVKEYIDWATNRMNSTLTHIIESVD